MGPIALVLGGAACVFEDIKKANSLFTPDFVIAINDIGMTHPRVDFWVTLHPGKMPEWLRRRAKNGHSMELTVITPAEVSVTAPTLVRTESDYHWSGLSGLYAVKVARSLGAKRVVLAGVPMDKSGHYLGSGGHWISLTRREAWLQQSDLRGVVKSMSGWTRATYGAPVGESHQVPVRDRWRKVG